MSTSKRSRCNGRRLLLCLAATIFARVTVGDARDVDVPSSDAAKADARHQEGLFQRSPPMEVAVLQDSVGAGGGGNDRDISVCLLLIVRNEEWNLRSNLPLWKDVADCYVIGVDDRTTDGTLQAIQEGLGEDKQRCVFRDGGQPFLSCLVVLCCVVNGVKTLGGMGLSVDLPKKRTA